MVKKEHSRKIDNAKYLDFLKVAQNFEEGARLASEFEYFNAAGVLIIHAAIALADSVTIKLASKKSVGENHYEVISLLNEVTPASELKTNSINHFKALIDHKNFVSYSGDIYFKKDVDKLWKHFDRFKSWTEIILK